MHTYKPQLIFVLIFCFLLQWITIWQLINGTIELLLCSLYKLLSEAYSRSSCSNALCSSAPLWRCPCWTVGVCTWGSCCDLRWPHWFSLLNHGQAMTFSWRNQSVNVERRLIYTQISLYHGVRAQLLWHTCRPGGSGAHPSPLVYKGSSWLALRWEDRLSRTRYYKCQPLWEGLLIDTGFSCAFLTMNWLKSLKNTDFCGSCTLTRQIGLQC